jgi:pyruvate-formate lyase-activating enzyme
MKDLHFNGLVLIPSDHCNIRCRHCAPECGPDLKSPWDVEALKKCITDAAKIPNLRRRVHFAGGEPFLYFNQMLEVCAHAHESGFVHSVVTNGFWAKNPTRAITMFQRLVTLGLCRVELSTDVFHQEFLPMHVVHQAIQVLKEVDVPITLRVVTTRKHSVDTILRQLKPEDLNDIEIVGAPVVPVGRAAYAVPKNEFYLSTSGACGSCDTLLNLTVRSDGNVYPCCAGSEENPSLSLGNISQFPIDALVQNAEMNLMIRRLVHSGPSSFFAILREEGLGHKIRPEYTNICHACTELFADAEVVDSIRRRTHTEEQQLLAELLVPASGSAGASST